MAYAQVNGLELYYETHGSGKPLVLLPGGLLTIGLSFGDLLPVLAERRQVIAVELQGHGHTADIEREPSFPNLASDVVALLDTLGIERADLFGFSFGGLVALQTVMDYPQRVDRLIAAATHFRSDGYHVEIRDPELWATSSRMPTEDDFRAMREAYVQVAPDPDGFDAIEARLQPMVGGVDSWSLDDLRGITAPTLLAIGDNDFVTLEHANQMRELIPNSRLAVLPATTHMAVVQRVELWRPMIAEFLQ